MAVRIRLKRMGRRNRPAWRICVMDARTRRDGRSIEDLGFYDTLAKDPEKSMKVDVERARYWLRKGAQPSDTVKQIFKKLGVTRTADPKSIPDESEAPAAES